MATPAAPVNNTIRLLQGGNGKYPMVLELIPNRLRLTIHHSNQFVGTKPVGYWTFESSGLLSLRQKELIVSLRIKDGEATYPFPKVILRIFLLIYKQAMQQRRILAGDVIKLGEQGILGYIGLGFVRADSVRLPIAPSAASLAGIFLHRGELLMAHHLGLSRVMSALSWQAKRHPAPLVNDRDRPILPMEVALKNSQIGELPRKLVRGSAIHMMDGEQVIFSPPPELHPLFVALFKKLGTKQPVCLITTDLESYDGSLVWMPTANEIEINIGAGKEGNTIAGCFVYLLPNQNADGVTLMEDGFLVSLTAVGWHSLKHAINNRSGFTLKASDGEMDFVWRWRGDELLPVLADPNRVQTVKNEGILINVLDKILDFVDTLKRRLRRE